MSDWRTWLLLAPMVAVHLALLAWVYRNFNGRKP